MSKIKKGSYGYLTAKRNRTLVLVIFLLALILAIYFGAYAYFGTNQTWFTIIAALICLPTAKIIVSLIMFFKASGCSTEAYSRIRQHTQDMPNTAYELYMTTERENYALSHAVVAAGSVIAFTEDAKCNVGNGQAHIRHMMQGNGYHGYTVKIFNALDSYVERLDALRSVAADEDPKDAEVLQLLGQLSL